MITKMCKFDVLYYHIIMHCTVMNIFFLERLKDSIDMPDSNK
jgi:hypothetical protein